MIVRRFESVQAFLTRSFLIPWRIMKQARFNRAADFWRHIRAKLPWKCCVTAPGVQARWIALTMSCSWSSVMEPMFCRSIPVVAMPLTHRAVTQRAPCWPVTKGANASRANSDKVWLGKLGAGNGNRTRNKSLGSSCDTFSPYPPHRLRYALPCMKARRADTDQSGFCARSLPFQQLVQTSA